MGANPSADLSVPGLKTLSVEKEKIGMFKVTKDNYYLEHKYHF